MTLDYAERSSEDWRTVGEAALADTIELRRAIHADPEIGLRCDRTTDKLKAALAGLPLEIREGPSSSGFVAILRCGAGGGNDNGRTILLRGDMDALPMTEETGLPFASKIPGAMHACGHDSHSAMLVGAARALSAKREQLSGTIVFMFQPGEEGYHGARHMIADGLLDDPRPETAFALHVMPNAPAGKIIARAGPMMAAVDTLHATITGRGGHAALPHECLDPIPIACEIITALQTFIARQIPVTDPVVLTITMFHAGAAHNVIPDAVELTGTLRTLSDTNRERMRAAFQRIAEQIALAHGATAQTRIEEGYPATVTDPRAIALVKDVAIGLRGEDVWETMAAPMMGAEDFSYVLREVPGAFAFIGAAAPGSDLATTPSWHSTRMTIEESVMAEGIALHCAVAERFLDRGFDD